MLAFITLELSEYIPQLAMCESLSLHSLLQPSMANYCDHIHDFILYDVYNGDENEFNKWWDINVVPFVDEFYNLILKESSKDA
tara:strand:- start:364 stop:612 length:249 start_codon:yes stop_codon:yes gene_type:complete